MITKDGIEQAYAFLHQKYRVYAFSRSNTQKDDIEYAISSFVEDMNRELYAKLAHGKKDFLNDHTTFAEDMQRALEELEQML